MADDLGDEEEDQVAEEEYFEESPEALNVTEEQLTEIRETYNIFDPMGNGYIPAKNFGLALNALGYNKNISDLEELILMLDPNETGNITYIKFFKTVAAIINDTSEVDEIREAFQALDENGDGFITTENLKDIVKSVGEPLTDEEISEMIRETDKSEDEMVNYEEFLNLMTNK